MKIAQLETFVVVAEELHFRRAAERLYTQPSTVSTQISQLETEYGTPLFIRNSRNVTLSPAGETLLEKAKHVLAGINDLEQTAKSLAARDNVSLTVGLHDEGAAELNQIMMGSWRLRYPNGDLGLREIDYADLETALRSGLVDCLLTTAVPHQFEQSEFERTDLFQEGRVIALPTNHPLAEQTHIDLETALSLRYLAIPDVNDALTRFFLNQDLRDTSDDRLVDATTLATMLHHVALGDGVITVTHGVERFFARPDVVFVPVPGLESATVKLISRAGDSRRHLLAFKEAAVIAATEHLDLIPTATNATTGAT